MALSAATSDSPVFTRKIVRRSTTCAVAVHPHHAERDGRRFVVREVVQRRDGHPVLLPADRRRQDRAAANDGEDAADCAHDAAGERTEKTATGRVVSRGFCCHSDLERRRDIISRALSGTQGDSSMLRRALLVVLLAVLAVLSRRRLRPAGKCASTGAECDRSPPADAQSRRRKRASISTGGPAQSSGIPPTRSSRSTASGRRSRR